MIIGAMNARIPTVIAQQGGGSDTERWWAEAVVHPTAGKGTHTTIQAAIDALGTDGGVIFIAPGTYTENLTIASNTKYLRIVGSGIGKTILKSTTSGTPVIMINSGCEVIAIEHLTVEHTQTASGSHCIATASATTRDIRIHHVYLKGGDRGIYLYAVYRAWIHACHIYDPANYGIWVRDYEDIFITDNRIYSSGASSIYCSSTNRFTIRGNIIMSPASYGVYVSGGERGTVQGNVVRLSSGTAIYCASDYTEIIGNTCHDVGGYGIHVQGANGVTVAGNAIYVSDNDSIYIQECDVVAVTGNTIRYSGNNGIYCKKARYCTFNGNAVYDSNGDGFTCYNSSTYATKWCTIVGNTFCENDQYGIDLAGTYAQYITIVGNVLRDNTSGATHNTGGTGNVVANNVT